MLFTFTDIPPSKLRKATRVCVLGLQLTSSLDAGNKRALSKVTKGQEGKGKEGFKKKKIKTPLARGRAPLGRVQPPNGMYKIGLRQETTMLGSGNFSSSSHLWNTVLAEAPRSPWLRKHSGCGCPPAFWIPLVGSCPALQTHSSVCWAPWS